MFNAICTFLILIMHTFGISYSIQRFKTTL